MGLDSTSRFVKVSRSADIPPNSVRVFQVSDRRIVICNLDGKFYAVDDRCTHDNGPLGEGELIDGEIECPRHGARFDIKTGKATCLPAVGAVASYSIDVVDGDIFVSLPVDAND